MFWTTLIYLPQTVNKCAACTEEKLQGRLILRLFVSHINHEPLLFSLLVTLRRFWAGLHLKKALRWKLALTCTRGKRLWYLCCWASIWTPEASCPPRGRSWPDGFLLGGSLEVPVPFWSRGPRHLQADMKEAQLVKVPVHCNATLTRHRRHQRWSLCRIINPSSIHNNLFHQLYRNPRSTEMPVYAHSSARANKQSESNHAKVIATCFYKGGEILHGSAGEPKTASAKPFKSSICGFRHTSQEQGSKLWFEIKKRQDTWVQWIWLLSAALPCFP